MVADCQDVLEHISPAFLHESLDDSPVATRDRREHVWMSADDDEEDAERFDDDEDDDDFDDLEEEFDEEDLEDEDDDDLDDDDLDDDLDEFEDDDEI